jgi:hypothetical protein
MNGAKRNPYKILVGKPEGKRPLGRPRRICVDSIKMDLREIGWDGLDCTQQFATQDTPEDVHLMSKHV